MTKPSTTTIRNAVALTQRPERGPDPILRCNVCGRDVDPDDLPCTAWREHDERDKPIPGPGALVFLGSGDDHAACQKALDDHPRLYAEEMGLPGTFPRLCGPCIHRRGFACAHPDLKANGGAGLEVKIGGLAVHVCRSGGRGGWLLRPAVACAGREVSG